jgi:periplasmic divalent cation tolerance protein
MEGLVVFITASDEDEAVRIANILVGERLAGCVNIIKGIRSVYSWQGEVRDDPEALMIVKTISSVFPALQKRVKELHGYTVPEIIALRIEEGSADYMKWLKEVTGQ